MSRKIKKERSSLFLVDRLELYCLISVLSSAGRASAVQILFNMMPTETAYLETSCSKNECPQKREHRPGSHIDMA